MIKWSRVRLILSIIVCEGFFVTLRERIQYAPGGAQRGPGGSENSPALHDYCGTLHVHSTYSDGTGTIAEVARAANAAGLDYLLMCDHSNLDALTTGEAGWQGRTLVLIGTEVTTNRGHLLALNVPQSYVPAPDDAIEAQRKILEQGGFAIVALPCDLKDSWKDFAARLPTTGLEIFNLSSIARNKINLPALVLMWRRYNSNRKDKAFSLVSGRPDRELKLWDELIGTGTGGKPLTPVVGIASVDAHAVMRIAGRELPYPTYEESCRTVRTHVLTREPLSGGVSLRTGADNPAARDHRDSALVYAALESGHCYMSYDNFADPSGFRFEAAPEGGPNPAEPVIMGDSTSVAAPESLNATPRFRLTASTPRKRALLRLFRNGKVVASSHNGRLEHTAAQPGSYRIEVYLYKSRIGNFCLGAKPWIFSNPIYLQPQSTMSDLANDNDKPLTRMRA